MTQEQFKEIYDDLQAIKNEAGEIADEDFIKWVRFNAESIEDALKIAAGV